MYSGIFNENHQITLSKYPDFKHVKKVRTGHYDKNILCEKCDNEVIGKYESYGARVLYYGKNDKNENLFVEPRKSHDGVRTIYLKNIDYRKFKLFILSILWKAGISKQEYFEEITLGKHKETLRMALLNNDPLTEKDYQACILVYNPIGNLPKEFILNPRKINDNADPSFCFYINGAFYFFTLDKNPPLDIYAKGHIKESNEMEIPLIDSDFVKLFLKSIWNIQLK